MQNMTKDQARFAWQLLQKTGYHSAEYGLVMDVLREYNELANATALYLRLQADDGWHADDAYELFLSGQITMFEWYLTDRLMEGYRLGLVHEDVLWPCWLSCCNSCGQNEVEDALKKGKSKLVDGLVATLKYGCDRLQIRMRRVHDLFKDDDNG